MSDLVTLIKSTLEARHNLIKSKDVESAILRVEKADEAFLIGGLEVLSKCTGEKPETIISYFAINDNKAKHYIPVKGLIKAVSLIRFFGGDSEEVLDNHLKLFLVGIAESLRDRKSGFKNEQISDFNLHDVRTVQTFKCSDDSVEMQTLEDKGKPDYNSSTSNTQSSQIKTMAQALGLITGEKFDNRKMKVKKLFLIEVLQRADYIHPKYKSRGYTFHGKNKKQ